MSTMIIKAVITSVSPINISEHDKTNKVPVAMVSGVSHACIPGSSFRGALRRAARHEIDLKRAALGLPKWDLKEFYWHTIGGIKLSKNDEGNAFKNDGNVIPFTLVENVRKRNPFMSVFGTFDPFPISGRIQVGNAVCRQPAMSQNERGYSKSTLDSRVSVRTDPLQRDSSIASMLLDDDALDLWAETTKNARQGAALRAEISELDEKMRKAKRDGNDAELKALSEQKSKVVADEAKLVKASAGSSVSLQQIVDPIEYIPAGEEMDQRIRVVNASDAELGLILVGMQHFAGECMIGGKRNIGAGEVKVAWSLVIDGVCVAEIAASLDDGFVVVSGEKFVKQKISAWNDFAKSKQFDTSYPTKADFKVEEK